jgi:hypothetical protein
VSWEKSLDYLVQLCHGETVKCTYKKITLEVKRRPSYFEVNVNNKFKLLLISASNEILFLRPFSKLVMHPDIFRDVLVDGSSVDEDHALQLIEQTLLKHRLTPTEREYFMTRFLRTRLLLMLPHTILRRTLENGINLTITKLERYSTTNRQIRLGNYLKVENNAGLTLMLPAFEAVEAVLADLIYLPIKCSRSKAMFLVQNADQCAYFNKNFTKRVEKGDDNTAAFAESLLTGENPFILKLMQPPQNMR